MTPDIEVVCHTNLDLRNEQWPTLMPAVPRVGEQIQSSTVWKDNFQLSLEVDSVTWKKYRDPMSIIPHWKPYIELHIPRRGNWSIKSFYEWYAPLVGRSVSSFT